MALTPRSVFRYNVVEGVPSSGKHKPEKAEIIPVSYTHLTLPTTERV